MRFILLAYLLVFTIYGSWGQTAQPLPFNTPYPEYAPVLSWDGNTLYFAKDEAPGNLGASNQADIWRTGRTGKFSWSPPINIGRPLNDEATNIPVGITPLQDRFFMVRKNEGKRYQYLMAEPEGRVWTHPSPLAIKWMNDGSFLASQIKAFHLSYDRQFLVFLAETHQGCGQLDIYVSTKNKNGEWGFPFNLGTGLNSDANERSVFLAADHQSLYFSSNGHGGYGGYDLFVSRRLDDSWVKWSEPVNLGPSVNTEADEWDPSLSILGDELFFSRKTTQGDKDVYSCPLDPKLSPAPHHIIHGQLSTTLDQFALRLQIQTVEGQIPEVLQLETGSYFSLLPTQQSYLLYQSTPSGLISESFAFFQTRYYDADPAEYWARLQRKESYRERESRIQQLKNEQDRLNQEIRQMVTWQNAHLSQLDTTITNSLNTLKWGEKTQSKLNEWRQKYEQLRRSQAPLDSIDQQPQDAPKTVVIEKKDHFRKQKERLRRQLEKKAKDTSARPEEAGLTIKGPPNITSFDQLQRDIFHQLLNEKAPTLWGELEARLFETQLQKMSDEIGQREVNRLKKFGIPDNEKGVDYLEALSGFPQDEQPLPFPWQRDIQNSLTATLQKAFEQQLPELLRPRIEELLRNKIMLAGKRHQAFFQYQELQSAISQQLSEEQKLKSGIPTEVTAGKPKENRLQAASRQLIQEHDFKVYPVRIGLSLPLPGIVFEPNTSRLSPLSAPEVNRLIGFLKQHSDLVVEIGLYAYGDISHQLALNLASERAEVLVNYLVGKGISADRLVKKPYGKKEKVDYKYSWRNNIVVIKILK